MPTKALLAVGFLLRTAVGADATRVDHHADAGQVSGFQLCDLGTDGEDAPDDLMAGNHGVDRPAPLVTDLVNIRVADAGIKDLDGDVVGAGFPTLKLKSFKRGANGLGGVSDRLHGVS